ncbi:unnamed protein product [Chrysoparadoxa australica]
MRETLRNRETLMQVFANRIMLALEEAKDKKSWFKTKEKLEKMVSKLLSEKDELDKLDANEAGKEEARMRNKMVEGIGSLQRMLGQTTKIHEQRHVLRVQENTQLTADMNALRKKNHALQQQVTKLKAEAVYSAMVREKGAREMGPADCSLTTPIQLDRHVSAPLDGSLAIPAALKDVREHTSSQKTRRSASRAAIALTGRRPQCSPMNKSRSNGTMVKPCHEVAVLTKASNQAKSVSLEERAAYAEALVDQLRHECSAAVQEKETMAVEASRLKEQLRQMSGSP